MKNETNISEISLVMEADYAAVRDAVQNTHGGLFVLITFLCFQFVNWRLQSQGPPKNLKCDEWIWRNLYVSWLHAVVTTTWIMLGILLYPEMFSSVSTLMQHITHLTYFCVCFSTGYFLYDFADVVVNKKLIAKWEVIIHHIVVLGIFIYNILFKVHIAFSIVALFVEINSVFLHWRKLLQMVKTPFDNRQYLIIKYINLVTFFICRGGVMVVISTSCYFSRHKMTFAYFLGLSFTMALFDVLNTVLFWRILKSDILRGSKATKSRSVWSNIKYDWLVIFGYQDQHSNGDILVGNNNVAVTQKKEE